MTPSAPLREPGDRVRLALAIVRKRRRCLALWHRRVTRSPQSRTRSLYWMPSFLKRHLNRTAKEAAKHCFNVAEALRTEAVATGDLADARMLYRLAMRGGGDRSLRARARERLLLMICQRPPLPQNEADLQRTLRAGGYVCRLAPQILRYPRNAPASETFDRALAPPRGTTAALDGALPDGMLRHLQRAFAPSSPFWREHGYRCGLRRSPFFSYVHSLEGPPRCGFDRILRLLQRRAAEAGFAQAAKAKFVEWWAHCRPHGVGHQLHFDSDDEGNGGVRNPLLSSALYLTGGGIGGPTLVTNQRMGEARMATRGWMVMPEENRYLLFDGKLLHGVVPGRGKASATAGAQTRGGSGRRISLMVAYWHSIEQRQSSIPCAARPFPYKRSPSITWPTLFDWPLADDADAAGAAAAAISVAPRPVAPVWVATDGDTSTTGRSMPEYDECFQGLC